MIAVILKVKQDFIYGDFYNEVPTGMSGIYENVPPAHFKFCAIFSFRMILNFVLHL